MRVFPTADGFKSFLVMRREPATNRFSFAIDAPGTTLAAEEDGSISMSDETGTVIGKLPRPGLLDSSDVDGNGGGVFTAATTLTLATDGPLPVITVGVERRYLDEAVYPTFIDLSMTDFPVSTSGADLTFASSRHPNANFERYQRPEGAAYAELWHGRQPGSRHRQRDLCPLPGPGRDTRDGRRRRSRSGAVPLLATRGRGRANGRSTEWQPTGDSEALDLELAP